MNEAAHKGPIQQLKHVPKPTIAYQQLKPAEFHNPRLVLCASCEAFHQRPAEHVSYDTGGNTCDANKQSIVLSGGRNLTWWRAHLAVRAGRLSPEHGEPIEIEDWACGKWQYSLCAKIVRGRLLIRVTGTTEFRLEEIKGEALDVDDAPICGHAQKLQKTKLLPLIREAILGFTSTGGLMEYRGREYRCLACSSQYVFIVRKEADPGQGRHSMSVCRYIDVGSCETPGSREWTSLKATKLQPACPRLPYPPHFKIDGVSGTIKERFEGRSDPIRRRVRRYLKFAGRGVLNFMWRG